MAELDAHHGPWSPDSYSYSGSENPYSPITPPPESTLEDYPVNKLRAVEIYTSSDYADRSSRRPAGGVPRLAESFGVEQLDPNFSIIDAEFGDNINALLGELEAAGISERVGGSSKGKGKAKDSEVNNWISMTSNMGVPRLEVRTTA